MRDDKVAKLRLWRRDGLADSRKDTVDWNFISHFSIVACNFEIGSELLLVASLESANSTRYLKNSCRDNNSLY
jgi:hypothetical protein